MNFLFILLFIVVSIYGLYFSAKLVEFSQVGFQDPATPVMQELIDLHHDVFFFFVVFFIMLILFHILKNMAQSFMFLHISTTVAVKVMPNLPYVFLALFLINLFFCVVQSSYNTALLFFSWLTMDCLVVDNLEAGNALHSFMNGSSPENTPTGSEVSGEYQADSEMENEDLDMEESDDLPEASEASVGSESTESDDGNVQYSPVTQTPPDTLMDHNSRPNIKYKVFECRSSDGQNKTRFIADNSMCTEYWEWTNRKYMDHVQDIHIHGDFYNSLGQNFIKTMREAFEDEHRDGGITPENLIKESGSFLQDLSKNQNPELVSDKPQIIPPTEPTTHEDRYRHFHPDL